MTRRLGSKRLPQPEKAGPAWDAFVAWWKTQAVDADRKRAVAWRSFHAGWHACEAHALRRIAVIEAAVPSEAVTEAWP